MDDINVIMPDGPTVTIHKGWQIPGRRRKTTSPTPSIPPLQQQREVNPEVDNSPSPHTGRHFEFVNAVRPGRNKDPEVRKLVRTHVRNEHIRSALQPRDNSPRKLVPSMTDQSDSDRDVSRTASWSTRARRQAANPGVPQNIGHPTALVNFDFPIEMTSSIHLLLENYLTHTPRRLYPLESCLKSNPLKSSEWFQYAMRDAAMLHGMLYAGALYLALLEGKTETDDTLRHFGHVVSIVNQRLGEPGREIDDATIGAISCLALGEAIKGNKDHWKTHMVGIKQMIESRRSVYPLPALLKAKLRRSDITGAIDYAATPVLDFHRSTRQTTWSLLSKQMICTVDREMRKILTACEVHPDLISIMTELACFAQAIRFASEASIFFDPTTFSEDLYFLEYNFLAFSPSLPDGEPEAKIDQACRLGALLYLKAVLQEFPHSTTGSTFLLTHLQEALEDITIQQSNSALLLWLALVGGSPSKGEMRLWFVDYLVRIQSVVLVISFDDFEVDMSRMLGLKKVFGRSFEALWNETMVRSGAYFA